MNGIAPVGDEATHRGRANGHVAPVSPPARRPPAAAWRIIAFSSVAMTMTVFGQTPGVSVFVDPVSRELGLTRSEISSVYSLATLVAALFLPWMGRRIDRHGVRQVALVVAGVFGLVVVGLAFAQGLAWVAVGFFGIRLLGQGTLSLAARTIVAIRFRSGLGRAVAISGAIAAVGMSIVPLALAALITASSWRATWILGGLSIWLVVIPLSHWFLRPGDDRPIADEVHPAEPTATDQWTRRRAVRSPIFWLVTLVGASVAMILTGLSFHQISILGEAGLSPTAAAANYVPQTIAAVAAITIVGPLSERIPARFLIVASMGLLAAGTGLVFVLALPWAPLAYAIALGGALGSSQALEGTLYPRFFGVRAIAAIRGAAFTITIAAAALGPVVVGLVHDATGTYEVAALLLIGIPIAIGVSALLIPEPSPAPEPR